MFQSRRVVDISRPIERNRVIDLRDERVRLSTLAELRVVEPRVVVVQVNCSIEMLAWG